MALTLSNQAICRILLRTACKDTGHRPNMFSGNSIKAIPYRGKHVCGLAAFVCSPERLWRAFFSRVFSHAAPPDRSRGIEDSRLVVLSRDINPLARPAYMRGLVDPSRRTSGVSFELQPAARQQTALNVFLKAQRDPGSPEYRHSLTPEEFGDRFGVSRNDLAHLTCWLADQGL